MDNRAQLVGMPRVVVLLIALTVVTIVAYEGFVRAGWFPL